MEEKCTSTTDVETDEIHYYILSTSKEKKSILRKKDSFGGIVRMFICIRYLAAYRKHVFAAKVLRKQCTYSLSAFFLFLAAQMNISFAESIAVKNE